MTTPTPKPMTLLPPTPGNCQTCAAYHHPDEPHSLHSTFYQAKFQQEHGRAPTWDDALADCPPDVQAGVRAVLRRRGLLKEGESTAQNAPTRRAIDPRHPKLPASPRTPVPPPVFSATMNGEPPLSVAKENKP